MPALLTHHRVQLLGGTPILQFLRLYLFFVKFVQRMHSPAQLFSWPHPQLDIGREEKQTNGLLSCLHRYLIAQSIVE